MTDIDLDALEATARAATPGPWHRHPHPLDDQMSDIRGPINDDYDVVVYAESDPSDAEHIAAFDPPTALALIARIREAEANLASETAAHDDTIRERDRISARLREAEKDMSRYEGIGRVASSECRRADLAEERLREAEAVLAEIRANAAELLDADDDSYDGSLSAIWAVELIDAYKTTKTENANNEGENE